MAVRQSFGTSLVSREPARGLRGFWGALCPPGCPAFPPPALGPHNILFIFQLPPRKNVAGLPPSHPSNKPFSSPSRRDPRVVGHPNSSPPSLRGSGDKFRGPLALYPPEGWAGGAPSSPNHEGVSPMTQDDFSPPSQHETPSRPQPEELYLPR